MRRPRPIRRLVDGRPDASGRAISRRLTLLMVPAVAGANAAGATVVFVLAGYVVPTPALEDETRVLLINLVALGVFGALAIPAGIVMGYRQLRPARSWLLAEREPDARERRKILRAPLRQLLVSGALWLLAVVAFAGLNAVFSLGLAIVVAITVLIGGLTTCAVTYLLTERLTRPVVARALAAGVPDRPVLPGIVTRSLLAWLLGSALPIVGLLLVAIAVLAGRDVGDVQLAITAVALGGVSLTVGLLITWQAARGTADPVLSVREALARVERGDFEAEVPVFDGSELGLLQAGFNRMASGLREREQLRDVFGRHVGADVARAALDRGPDMGGETREVAVLFTDIVGSTTIAAERPPHETVELLNGFFAVVVEVVEEHGGWINKFQGDAALAVFGAPLPQGDCADRALAAARALAERVRELPEVRAGIGLSAGRVLAGNVGAEQRFEYTVIGDPVNEAARLTELAKGDDTGVIASEAIVSRAGPEEAGRWDLGESTELRGRPEPTRLARPGNAARDDA